jgi:hypothetical protein
MIFTYWTGVEPDGKAGDTPPAIAEAVQDWRAVFPEFHIFKDRDVRRLLARRGAEQLDLFDAITIPACRADLARLLLLHEFGGLYVDAHVGTGDLAALAGVLERLSQTELVLFDKTWMHKHPGDIHIMNTVMCARRQAPAVEIMIESALRNLARQHSEEKSANGYVSYNIFVLTGAWDIQVQLFDLGINPIMLRSEFRERVWLERLTGDDRQPVQIYKYYAYRRPGLHWSERQKTERLFKPSSPSARDS